MAKIKVLAVLLMLVSSTIQESNYYDDPPVFLRKCCAENYFLTVNDTCASVDELLQDDLIFRYKPEPLYAIGPKKIGFPVFKWNETSYVNDYCIDKKITVMPKMEINETIIAKSTVENTDITKYLNYLLNIQKCCPLNMSYDTQTHSCVNTKDFLEKSIMALYANSTRFINLQFGLKNCRKAVIDYTDIDYRILLVDEDLVVTNKATGVQELLQKDDFCVDQTVEGNLLAKVCRNQKDSCKGLTCISKCCPDGYSMYNGGVLKQSSCLPSFHVPFTAKIEKVGPNEEVVPDLVDHFAIVPDVQCDYGKYVLDPISIPSDAHFINRNGSLIVGEEMQEFKPREFCTETLFTIRNDSLKNNGLLMFVCFPSITEWVEAAREEAVKLMWYGIGTLMSVAFLLATFLVYCCLPELRNLHGKTLMCHTMCLMLALLSLSLLQIKLLDAHLFCIAAGFFILFMFLASFSWLNIMCFDIWWTFGSTRNTGSVRRRNEWRRFGWYNLYSWGVATVFTGGAIIAQYTELFPPKLHPRLGSERCFFAKENYYGKLPYFLLPITLQIICNVVLFGLTAHHCSRVKAEIHRMQLDSMGQSRKRKFYKDRAKLVMNCKLFIVMGVSWSHEIIATIFVEPEWIWYIGDAINIFIGIPIFCIFVLKPKVLRLLRHRLGFNKHSKQKTHSTATTVPNTDVLRINKSISIDSTSRLSSQTSEEPK